MREPAGAIVLLMGVSGSGKTTVGTLLAEAMGCPFVEGDALHSPANIEKMRRGIPLTDADRLPWLLAVRARVVEAFERGEDLVVACSALKEAYRRTIAGGIPVLWVHLTGPPALLHARLEGRQGHYMKADMLASQLADLEQPADALVVDVQATPDEIVQRILSELRRRARPDVRVFATLDELCARVAEVSAETIDRVVRARGSCSLVLSGGSTPRPLYARWASQYREGIPWRNVHVFWADERYVPHSDPESNYRMAKEALLDHVPCPEQNVHPIPTHFDDPDAAARSYEETLRAHFRADWPSFDLVYLGVGSDGHTASLFPGSAEVEETVRWVVATESPAGIRERITLTLPALLRSTHIHVLAAGPEKRAALRSVLTGVPDAKRWPASGVRAAGTATWWLDRAAADDEVLAVAADPVDPHVT